MKLATAQDVLNRMSMSSANAGSVNSADSVLEGITPIIENILGTPLAVADRIDYYDHLPSKYESATLSQERFYLTQMFVDGNLKVYVSADGSPLKSVTGLIPLDAANVVSYNAEGEFLLSSDSVYEGRSQIAVKYSAGFKDADPAIPSWLKEAAISGAIRVMHSQTIAHNKKDVPDMSVELHRIMYQQLVNRIRPRYSGRFPSATVEL